MGRMLDLLCMLSLRRFGPFVLSVLFAVSACVVVCCLFTCLLSCFAVYLSLFVGLGQLFFLA